MVPVIDTAVITVDIAPSIQIGPLTLAWHGITTAAGIALGLWLSTRYARRRGLATDRVLGAGLCMALGGFAGARIFYLAVNDPAALLRPADWIGGNGYAIYGGVAGGLVAAAVYAHRNRLDLRHLDALAFGFPLGLALGRVGDVINGEHYGPASSLPWAVRHPHPDALVPDPSLAYHDGGLYEVALGLALAVVMLPLRNRLRQPGDLLWAVLGLYAAGRFAMFFYRSDSDAVFLGLVEAQLTSLALLLVALLGAAWQRRRAPTVAAVAGVAMAAGLALVLAGCSLDTNRPSAESASPGGAYLEIPTRYAERLERVCRAAPTPVALPAGAVRGAAPALERAFARLTAFRGALERVDPAGAGTPRRRLLAAIDRELQALQAVLHPQVGDGALVGGDDRGERLNRLVQAQADLHRILDHARLSVCSHGPAP